MKTSKPISTISYNSKPYLVKKLNDLKKAGILEFWSFIEHEPESDEIRDEAGKKSISIYIVFRLK